MIDSKLTRSIRPILTNLTLILFLAAALNALFLLVLGQYNFRLGPIHLIAHGLFKPLQFVAGAFWLAIIARMQPDAT